MPEETTATASITTTATPAKIWDALTDPELVKEYLFGARVESDWEKGSKLLYKGDWNGKPYEDGGTILDIEPGHLLRSTYRSSLSELEDKPENYNVLTYEITRDGDQTKLTVTQTNNSSAEAATQSAANWEKILTDLKAIVER